MWYICAMDYYSAKKSNEFESVLVSQMKLEPFTQSEVSQKDKNKYRILTHIYGIQENGIDEPICREGMETQTQRMDLWTESGKERMRQTEKVTSTYIHYHV